MALHRRNPKRDANEREIIEALKQIGCTVAQLSARGIPDLLVGYRGKNLLIEVKCEKGKLTEDQIERHASWMGEIHIARTPDEAIAIVTSTL
jgi:Holliday junction resolvase